MRVRAASAARFGVVVLATSLRAPNAAALCATSASTRPPIPRPRAERVNHMPTSRLSGATRCSRTIPETSPCCKLHGRALRTYVIGADYYLRQLPSADPHTSYELVQLADADDPATFASPASPGAPSSRSSPARRCPCHRPTTTPATCSAGSTTTNARGDMDPKATPATATP